MLSKYVASCQKELLLLWRDKVNLCLLFVMPMLLVFIITLIQESAITQRHNAAIKVLLVNQDKNLQLVKTITTNAKQQQWFDITEKINGKDLSFAQAKALVAKGDYMALIKIPPGATDMLKVHTKRVFVGVNKKQKPPEAITVVLDPNLRPAIQKGIVTALSLSLLQIKVQAIQSVVSSVLGSKITVPVSETHAINTQFATLSPQQIRPNSIQQNVPAWAVFGMFFIIVPISGMMIKERGMGVMGRVHTAPVASAVVTLAKVTAYIFINLIQLAMMLLVGLLILPMLGTPVLSLGVHPYLIIIAGVVTSLAATSLGMVLGMLLKTYEQSSVFGGILVVIAAAVGGIMVPIYLMPDIIQKIGSISPLRWAYNSFISIFVRGASLVDIMPQLILLFAFFVVCMLLTIVLMQRTRR